MIKNSTIMLIVLCVLQVASCKSVRESQTVVDTQARHDSHRLQKSQTWPDWNVQDQAERLFEQGMILEQAGEFADASQVYEDAVTTASDQRGATFLYRLFRVKCKQGDLSEARIILKRMAKTYPRTAPVSTSDFPVPEAHFTAQLGELVAQLEDILNAPLTISVTATKPTFTSSENPQFVVTFSNVSTNNITLPLGKQEGYADYIPACRPAAIIDSHIWVDFQETAFEAKPTKQFTLQPGKEVSYKGTFGSPICETGNHIIDFLFTPIFKLNTGKVWSKIVMVNSVLLHVQSDKDAAQPKPEGDGKPAP